MASTTASGGFSLVSSAVPVRWAGRSEGRRETVFWLPRQDQPIVGTDGRVNMDWWRFFAEVSRRLAGVQGPTLTEVSATASGVQQAVIDAQAIAEAALVVANATSTRVDAVKEVAVNAGLAGAGNIP